MMGIFLASDVAFADTVPSFPPESKPNITLSPAEVDNLQKYLGGATLHITLPDGTQHPLVDAAPLLQFLSAKTTTTPKLPLPEAAHRGPTPVPPPTK